MSQVIVQILLLIVSGVAVFSIVMPKLNEMGDIQKEITGYEQAIENAFASNERLNALVREADSLSQQERFRLETLVPQKIDPIRTAFNIETLIDRHNLFLITLEILDEISAPDPVSTSPDSGAGFGAGASDPARIATQEVEVVMAGTYEQFKAFLTDIETNARLMEVTQIQFASTNSDLSQFTMRIKIYGLSPSLTSQP